MALLCLGVLLFALAHLTPALDAGIRTRSLERFGKDGHRGVFSLVVLTAVALIVFGWRGTEPVLLYAPPSWSRIAANVAMALAFWLFVVSGAPSNVRRVLRHPQLISIVIWAGTHLVANGDARSLVLFGGLGSWALVMMPLLNRRDGAWERPEPAPLLGDAVVFVIAGAVFLGVRWAHPWFAGVSAAF